MESTSASDTATDMMEDMDPRRTAADPAAELRRRYALYEVLVPVELLRLHVGPPPSPLALDPRRLPDENSPPLLPVAALTLDPLRLLTLDPRRLLARLAMLSRLSSRWNL